MADVLAGCVTGARISPEIVGDPHAPIPQGIGHFLIALRVDAACRADRYEDSLSRLIAAVHDTPRADWAESFLIPGEREAHFSSERQGSIPLPPPTLELLRQLGAEAGVPFPR